MLIIAISPNWSENGQWEEFISNSVLIVKNDQCRPKTREDVSQFQLLLHVR